MNFTDFNGGVAADEFSIFRNSHLISRPTNLPRKSGPPLVTFVRQDPTCRNKLFAFWLQIQWLSRTLETCAGTQPHSSWEVSLAHESNGAPISSSKKFSPWVSSHCCISMACNAWLNRFDAQQTVIWQSSFQASENRSDQSGSVFTCAALRSNASQCAQQTPDFLRANILLAPFMIPIRLCFGRLSRTTLFSSVRESCINYFPTNRFVAHAHARRSFHPATVSCASDNSL